MGLCCLWMWPTADHQQHRQHYVHCPLTKFEGCYVCSHSTRRQTMHPTGWKSLISVALWVTLWREFLVQCQLLCSMQKITLKFRVFVWVKFIDVTQVHVKKIWSCLDGVNVAHWKNSYSECDVRNGMTWHFLAGFRTYIGWCTGCRSLLLCRSVQRS